MSNKPKVSINVGANSHGGSNINSNSRVHQNTANPGRSSLKQNPSSSLPVPDLNYRNHNNQGANNANVRGGQYGNNREQYNNDHGNYNNLQYNNRGGYRGENLPQPAQKKLSLNSHVGNTLLRAILNINRNLTSINDFFEEYDVYDGRIFTLWGLNDISNYTINDTDIKAICEQNQDTDRLLADTVTYKFLYGIIMSAPDCPDKLKHPIKPQPYSIYSNLDDNLSPELQKLIQDILSHQSMQSGRIHEGYDEIFGNKQNKIVPREVDRSLLQTCLTSQISTHTRDNVLDEFVDFVAYRRGINFFSKVKFVAAMRHMAIKFKPELVTKFIDVMPGMQNYTSENMHLAASHLQQTHTQMGNQMGGSMLYQPGPGMQNQPNMGLGSQSMIVPSSMPQGGMALGGGIPGQNVFQNALNAVSYAKNLLQQTAPGNFQPQHAVQIQQYIDQAISYLNQQQMPQDPNYALIYQGLQSIKMTTNINNLNNFAMYNNMLTQLQQGEPALQILVQNFAMQTSQIVMPQGSFVGAAGTPSYIQDLMSKISGHLNTQRKKIEEVFIGVPHDNIQNTMAIRETLFIDQIERVFHLKKQEAHQVAQQFLMVSIQQMQPGQNYVDFMSFSSKISTEQRKYDQLVSRYFREITELRESLKQRHTGTHKWFQPYVKKALPENSLYFDEFQQSIRNLNCPMVIDQMIQEIFTSLDAANNHRLPIIEIEGLFKEHARKQNPNINPEDILQSIMIAFSGDIQYIEAELRKIQQYNQNQLTQEDCLRFFQKFPDFKNFYNENELAFLLDSHSRSGGQIDVFELMGAFRRVLGQRNSRIDQNTPGIHNNLMHDEQLVPGGESWTPILSFAQFPSDGTTTGQSATPKSRPNRIPDIQELRIAELQKACFIKTRTVKDYFEGLIGAGREGQINKNTFTNAIQDLELHWPAMDCDSIFSKILDMEQTRYEEIKAQTIDEVVHWLGKVNLRDLHKEILTMILEKSNVPQAKPLEQSFETITARQGSGGYYQQQDQKTCDYSQLSDVLRSQNVILSPIDIKFLASQYIVSGRNGEIQYQKLIDDVRNAERSQAATAKPVGDPISICNAIVKQLQIYGKTVSEYIKHHAGRAGQYSEEDFIGVVSHHLQLVPEVCTIEQISFLWSKIDHRQAQLIPQSAVITYIEHNALKVDGLKNEIQKKLADNKDFEMRFRNNAIFSATGGQKIPIEVFHEILKSIFVSKIDYLFLTVFYVDPSGNFVNAAQLIQDSMLQRTMLVDDGSISGRGPGGLKSPPGLGSDKIIVDEKEAKAALAFIASQPLERRKEFRMRLSQLMKGNQSSFVNVGQFDSIVNDVFPNVTQLQVQLLEAFYQRPGDNQSFNIQTFQQDLHQLTQGQNEQQITRLDEQTKRIYAQLARTLQEGRIATRLVINLKDIDRLDSGYLNAQMIELAIDNTFRDKNWLERKPSVDDTEAMIRPLSRNTQKFYNVRQFLVHLFGQEMGDKYFLMDKQQLEHELGSSSSRGQFTLPQQVNKPVNQILGSIGHHLLRSGLNYEDALKHAMGPNNQDNRIKLEQIFAALHACRVKISIDEKNYLTQWFRQAMDAYNFCSALTFLNDIGLPPQTLQVRERKKPIGRELSPSELQEAQDLIAMVSRELEANQKQAHIVIEKYRKNRIDVGMTPKDFAMALKKEVPNLRSAFPNQKLSLLVHYLVQEDLGMVSFDKLYRALNLSERDPPLRQDQIDSIRQTKSTITGQLDRADIPIEVVHLVNYMTSNKISIHDMFKVVSQGQLTQDSIISERMFDECCQERGYEPKDRQRLIQSLTGTGTRTSGISLYELSIYRRKWDQRNSNGQGANIQNKYGKFDQSLKQKLNRISQWMKDNNFTTADLHTQLDKNQDGSVDSKEFIEGMTHLLIPGLQQKDYMVLFQSIDIDNNQYLSLNEFSLFLEGSSKQRNERISELPQEINEGIEREIKNLFKLFDEDGNGFIDSNELMKTFQGLGHEMDLERAETMIKSVDQDGDMKISEKEFMTLMKPQMQNRLLEQDDRIEDFRAMFKDADADYSGYLTADELYTVLIKNGIDLSYDELIELIQEFDVSGDAQLDIDEFVAMMNTSSDMAFHSQKAKHTYLKIRENRRLNVTDFMLAFKNLPSAFVPSVFHKKWVKECKNRPSDVLKAQLDPFTMTWKDMLPVITENLPRDMQAPTARPKIRPIPTLVGCEITLDSAQGILLPPDSGDFKRANITKRAIRIGIFDTVKKEYIANAIQVEANWQASAADKWQFVKNNTNSLNPALFRTTQKDNLDLSNTKFIFEFIMYYKKDVTQKGVKQNELSCGWAASDDLNICNKAQTLKLKVTGGSPTSAILIQETEFKKDRKGMQRFLSAFSGKITSQLTVGIKPHTSTQVEDWTKFHMNFLPSTCLIQKKLLLFVSGYRNYAGQTLLKESALGNFKQPGGSVVLSCFPKLIDNIDILEVLVQVWAEDVLSSLSAQQKKGISLPMAKAKDIIHRIYPVLFADEFQLHESNYMESACYDETLHQLRKDLLFSALREGSKGKQVFRKPIEEMTTFKPFNVRETKWDVWDVKESKYEQYHNLHQQRGMFDMNMNQGGSPPPQPASLFPHHQAKQPQAHSSSRQQLQQNQQQQMQPSQPSSNNILLNPSSSREMIQAINLPASVKEQKAPAVVVSNVNNIPLGNVAAPNAADAVSPQKQMLVKKPKVNIQLNKKLDDDPIVAPPKAALSPVAKLDKTDDSSEPSFFAQIGGGAAAATTSPTTDPSSKMPKMLQRAKARVNVKLPVKGATAADASQPGNAAIAATSAPANDGDQFGPPPGLQRGRAGAIVGGPQNIPLNPPK